MAKLGLTCTFSIVSWIFEKIKSIRNYFLLFFTEFKLFMLQNNIVNSSEILNKWNLLKTCIYPYQFLHNLQQFLLWGKWNFFNFIKTVE